MQFQIVNDTYPVFTKSLPKGDFPQLSMASILTQLQQQISQHPAAVEIALFDHYSHTASLSVGHIDENILDAKILMFCFGKHLPNAQMAALRPRSIAVIETPGSFEVTFMQPPMQEATTTMENWINALAFHISFGQPDKLSS